MAKRVVVLDTSIYCCWLKVPGKETAGSGEEKWDHTRTAAMIKDEIENGSLLVLPLATLIETGNHIAKAPHTRYETAQALADNLKEAANASTPWAAFIQQALLWEPQALNTLAETWPEQAARTLSLGDATIGSVADFYSKSGHEVYVLTADRGLQEHASTVARKEPRRRMRSR